MRFYFFLLFYFINLKCYSQQYNNEYYTELSLAEDLIMQNKYDSSLIYFNSALRKHYLPQYKLINYCKILKNNSLLKTLYLDTLIKYSALHASYESIYVISKFLKINIDSIEKKYVIDSFRYNKSKKLKYYLDSIVLEDQKIRVESKNANYGNIYHSSYEEKIKNIDYKNYIFICELLKNNEFNFYLDYVLNYLGVFQHFFFRQTDSMILKLDEIIMEKANIGFIDKNAACEVIDLYFNKNTAKHKANESYFFSPILFNTKYLIVFDRNEKIVEKNRKKWGLEPFEICLKKILWQEESYFKFSLNANNFDNFGETIEDEKKTLSELKKKNMSIYFKLK